MFVALFYLTNRTVHYLLFCPSVPLLLFFYFLQCSNEDNVINDVRLDDKIKFLETRKFLQKISHEEEGYTWIIDQVDPILLPSRNESDSPLLISISGWCPKNGAPNEETIKHCRKYLESEAGTAQRLQLLKILTKVKTFNLILFAYSIILIITL